MSHIKKTEECFDKLDTIKKRLMEWTEMEIAKGCDAVDGHELGCVVDMVKDLSCAQEAIWASCYHKSVVDAMGYGKELGYQGRPELAYVYPDNEANNRMGYNISLTSNKHPNHQVYSKMMNGLGVGDYTRGRHPHFEGYHNARAGYSATHSEAERQRMREEGNAYINDTVQSIKEMWSDADPELKQKIKNDLTRLMGEMN